MSSLSTNLKLIVPATSDPFKTSDFVTNWGLLDSHPGVAQVADLSTAGSWDGQTVYNQTDHMLYVWDQAHTSWRSPTSPYYWYFTATPNTILGTSASPYLSASTNFTVPFTTPVVITYTAGFFTDDVASVQATLTAQTLIDSAAQGNITWTNARNTSTTLGSEYAHATEQHVATLTAGTHSFQFKAYHSVSSGTDNIRLDYYKVVLTTAQKGVGSQ
jgi:hypothetical protein